MRKLTKEEAGKMPVRRGRSSPVRTAVAALQPGEILMVERKDWNQQNGPGQMCKKLGTNTGMEFKVSTLASGEGWMVERVK